VDACHLRFFSHSHYLETKCKVIFMENENHSPDIRNIVILTPNTVKYALSVLQEREVALKNLKENACFQSLEKMAKPFDLTIGLEKNALSLKFDSVEEGIQEIVNLPLRSLKSFIKDYFLIVESYEQAKHAGGARLESIDMARRGVHNEAAEFLRESLARRLKMDAATARDLFTLICVLHIGQVRGPHI